MTKDRVEIAMNDGIPFVIKMADGEKYEVTHRNQIALGKSHVIVLGEHDMPHVLPLLTMTGISYIKSSK